MTTSSTDAGNTIISTTSSSTKVQTLETKMASTSTTAAAPATAGADSNTVTAPREALITTAVNFLQNAKVRHTTLMQKQQFLRSKGLTIDEIQLACERAGVFSQDPNNSTVINMDINAQTHSQLALQPRQTVFGRIKEILHSMALISGLAYVIYMFWKRYIEAFLFGKKKKKSTDDALEDIEKQVDKRITEVNRELIQIRETLTQQQREHSQLFGREFNNFKSDLEAIKGLLLNRKQFASPLTAGPPSIPNWQLASSSRHHHHSQSDENEKADDIGSGSGSSETEVVTKNSDSSLEIM